MELTNSLFDTDTVKLSLSQTTPDLGLVNLVGILNTTVERDDVLNKDVDGACVIVVLLEDEEGLFVETVLNGDPGNLSDIVVLQLVDITNYLALVRTNGSQHHEVLQVLVVAEWRGLQNDLLEQFDKLDGQVGRQEGLDGDRDIIGVSAFRDGSSNNLVNQRTTVHVIGTKDLGPKLKLTTLDKVTSLLLEH